MIPFAYADLETANSNICNGICDVLAYVEGDKSRFGLENIDFSTLKLGEVINVYEYVDGTFVQTNGFYPIYYNGVLTALAVSPDGKTFQILTSMVKNIVSLNSPAVAIVYDRRNCYVYDGNCFTPIITNSEPMEWRGVLPTDGRNVNANKIELASLRPFTNLNYKPEQARTQQSYYSCNVQFVSQHKPSKLCWAASVACIVNYKKGLSLTAESVAISYYGSGNYNQAAADDVVGYILNTYYNLPYAIKSPSENRIMTNLSSNYPVYGKFRYLSGGQYGYHACTIYAINTTTDYISIMDPELDSSNGVTTGYLSGEGVYSYYRSDNGVFLTLITLVAPL